MIPYRKSSYEVDFYSRPVFNRNPENYQNYQQKNKKFYVLQDLHRSRMSEKEFYEKVKTGMETSNDRFGFTVGKILEIVNERDFSAFQLFKLLMNSKLKGKLKLIIYEDEKVFYPQFWHTITYQKDAVKIEGLKLLGFLTSEYIQNISQQTQIDCIKNLKNLSNLQRNSSTVVRLSLNCIGNILTHSKHKIVDENQEIFYNLYDILKNLDSFHKLDDHHSIRTLSALLRVLNCLHLDLKAIPQITCEFLVSQLNRYLYLGTHFFPLPNSCFSLHSDNSLETTISTSSSELSESEEFEDKKKEEICSKIRNYCAACLSNILRQNNKLIQQYLPSLLPSKVLSKEVCKFLEHMKDPLLLQNLDYSQKQKKREAYLDQLRDDFNDASLLYLLLFEENTKVRLSVCKTIAAILDGFHNEKLIAGLDSEKLEKTKIEPTKSASHQLYQIFKNLTIGVVTSILLEYDEAFFNHLLRLTTTMLAHQSYEKIGHLTIQFLVKNVLAKATLEYQYHTIFLNCITCFSALANGNFNDKKFEELALNENFNIVKLLFQTIKESMDILLYNEETKVWKQDGVSESTILLESIIALLKFPKHYVEHIIENTETLINILETLKNFDRKFINVIFKLVEETMKYITNNRSDSDNPEGDNEGFDTKEEVSPRNNYNSHVKVQRFHILLEKLLRQIISNINDENVEFALNILYFLEEGHWELYYSDSKQKLLNQIFRLNNIPTLKQSLLRLLGKICVFPTFIQKENFPKIIYNVFALNYPEKNTNVMIKNSWVLANLCANLKSFDVFTIEQNQEVLSMILGYCNSSKEKLVSNGFRALGYFISNNTDKTLCQIISLKNDKTAEVNKALNEIYLKPFKDYSVKVCWNVCVSLSNILKAYKPGFMKSFFKEDMLQNIAQILTTKNNFKTQIHCIEMLALAYTKFPSNPCFSVLPKALINIYFIVDEEEFDASEMRYLPHLRESANGLLIKLLEKMSFEKTPENLIDLLGSNPHKLLKIFYENLRQLYEHTDSTIKINNDGEDLNRNTTPQPINSRNSESDYMLNISVDRINRDESKAFKDYLEKVHDLCKKLVSLIDSSDDISVSFSVYESLQQLSEINLESKDQYIELELHNL